MGCERAVRGHKLAHVPVGIVQIIQSVPLIVKGADWNSGDTLLNSVFFPKLPCLISFLCQGDELSKVSPELDFFELSIY